jgi:hypothetical protein
MTSTSHADPVVSALQQVLAAQHAAVYSYPVLGVRLRDPAQVDRARQLEAAHRASRDALMAQLATRQVTPVAAQASYYPLEPATDPSGAQRWALQLEQSCTQTYRSLLVGTVSPTGADLSQQPAARTLRQQALTGLSIAAQNATEWRALLTPATPTVAFPGL